jgi:hypothetical protein
MPPGSSPATVRAYAQVRNGIDHHQSCDSGHLSDFLFGIGCESTAFTAILRIGYRKAKASASGELWAAGSNKTGMVRYSA